MRIIPTQMYSRVVGFFTNVNGWNPGKKAEFEDRIEMPVDKIIDAIKRQPTKEEKQCQV
jgi:hypothetical protein